MPRSYKSEGIVLRSMRYGEADRILHIFTPGLGRISAIAKGVRRTKSRFGGRLEQFSRVDLVMYRGRGDISTITQAQTLDAYRQLRESSELLDAAARGGDSVLRIFSDGEASEPAYNLLCHFLALLAKFDSSGGRQPHNCLLAFRVKLVLAAGFFPQLDVCARCGSNSHLLSFSAADGGILCSDCDQGRPQVDEEALTFVRSVLIVPLEDAPAATSSTLRQVDSIMSETLRYHAHVNLSPVAQ